MQEKKERGDYKTRAYFLIKDVLLTANGKHLRAEEIYDSLRERGAKVGLTTVYRQLARLADEGFARKTTTEGQGSCYSLVGARCAEHYHLVCTECGALSHLSCERIESLIHHIELHHGFTVSPAKTTLYGLCADCKRKRKEQK